MDRSTVEKRVSRFTRLPRSRSVSNMLDIVHNFTNLATDKSPSAHHTQSENAPNLLTSNEDGRWSIKSLKREWKTKTHTQSLSYVPDVMPSRTNENRYPITSSPPSRGYFSRTRSKSSCAFTSQEWPERTSSRKGWGLPFTATLSSKTLSRAGHTDDIRPRTQGSIGKRDPWFSSLARTVTPIDAKSVTECLGGKPPSRSRENREITQRISTEFKAINTHKFPTIAGKTSQISLRISVENEEQGLDHHILQHPGVPGNLVASHEGLRVDTLSLARSTLTPPEDQSLPESPGFPKMLAAMTFPSPPTAAGSASTEVGPRTPAQTDDANPPVVRPRTSSKRAYTSNGVLTTSLNQLLMQNIQPLAHHGEPQNVPGLPSMPGCSASNHKVEDPVIAAIVTQDEPSNMDDLRLQPSPATCATSIRTSYGSTTPTVSVDIDSPRESLASDITVMTSTRQGSSITDSACHIPITSTTSQSKDVAAGVKKCSPDPEAAAYSDFVYRQPISNAIPPRPHRDPSSINSPLQDHGASLYNKINAENGAIALSSRDLSGRKSIIERRIARRAKVQAYKRRDLDAAQFILKDAIADPIDLESTDSPVLGWFPGNAIQSQRLLHRKSPMASTNQLIPTTNKSAWRRQPLSLPGEDDGTTVPVVLESRSTSQSQSNGWGISAVMTTEVVPEQVDYGLLLRGKIGRNSISPIMVVTDLKPQPDPAHEPPTPSPTSIYPNFRTALRHNLKIIPQPRPRPLSILIHRNPDTGDIERTISATTSKSNRHSMTSMPTPPSSPSILSLRRRSHPAGIISLTQSPNSHNTPNSQPEEPAQHPIVQEKSYEDKCRATSIKERLQREKLAKEQEISDLVDRMIITPKTGEASEGEIVKDSPGEHMTQQIEKRLRRLEENRDSLLHVIGTLLENMSRTLKEIREDNNGRGLTMGEFTINMDAEAGRPSSNICKEYGSPYVSNIVL
ncbi:uncharacterized protein F4822DRAFT_427137 [Hypoxylon trugodes]|uniref:uncharacterized protein n=1 Tax=Hypoxylon trugodes TaxID=326681 RepID=UPI00219863F3|nr:uncharacterized protein F4822DRAFT_427137 [Hypoxylon trugodes]KAI1391285.1 hypothetical protein F4822DRAFT_427137 [Hypoxylon trugodes]